VDKFRLDRWGSHPKDQVNQHGHVDPRFSGGLSELIAHWLLILLTGLLESLVSLFVCVIVPLRFLCM
jgi:hypothetical protein